jgi:hypothetical protein
MSETGSAPEGAEQAVTDDASTLVSGSPAVPSSAAAVDGRNIDLLDSGPRALETRVADAPVAVVMQPSNPQREPLSRD